MADATQTTIIGPDTHIKGDMTFDGTARLLGSFEGTITAKGELQIAQGATCKAAVDAAKVTVDGDVDGNVTARDRVELTSKAKMKGDVVALRLVVAEGASFVGHCTVGPEATKGLKPAETGSMVEGKAGIPARADQAAKGENRLETAGAGGRR
jgi:cytoskeletal protein CcmA (bactofilin family)